VEAQDGRFVGRQRSVDNGVSRHYTYRNISGILKKVGSEPKEHNLVVSLRFSITKCVREDYNQRIMG
jgi:predicted NAD/FAD-binding protein